MQVYQASLGADARPCPSADCAQCKGCALLHKHGSFTLWRGVDGTRSESVQRYICPRCRRTWSVLPIESYVRRFLCANGLDARSLKAGKLESGPTKAFEAPPPNDLWMVDFACGPTLRGHDGKVISTHLCLIVDDHSRPIVFAGYYTSADTAAFLDCLKQAVLRRGLPVKLYPDQGKPFVNHHAKIVCANLGIRLLHAKPYHAWSKGKAERLIQTIIIVVRRNSQSWGGKSCKSPEPLVRRPTKL